jgi:hypothetical protein
VFILPDKRMAKNQTDLKLPIPPIRDPEICDLARELEP